MAKRPASTDQRRFEYLPLDELVPAERNPKRHDLPAIGRSIDRFGYVEPIVLDERTGRLVAGHGRLEQLSTARTAGGDAPDGVTVTADGGWQVPVLRGWASRSDADAAAYLAASNRLVELGGWDDAELGHLLADVTAVDADLAAIAGFDAAELSRLLSAAQGGPEARTDPDDVPAEPETPFSTPGDLWLLGPHRLLCGDSTVRADVERVLDGQRVPLMATDPPYLVNYDSRNHPASSSNGGAATINKTWDDYVDPESSVQFYVDFLALAREVALLPHAAVYQWYADKRTWETHAAWREAGFLTHQVIVWVKARAVLGRTEFMVQHEPCLFGWVQGSRPASHPAPGVTTVWPLDQVGSQDGIHPTQKPVDLIARCIEWHTGPGDWIYEPFGGSGTALIAAHSLGRKAAVIEKAPGFVDVICHRYQEHTGVVPVLESTGEPHDFTAA